MAVIGQKILSTLFSYKDKTFSADMSEMKGYEACGRLYNDAADLGFVLVSVKSIKEQAYYLNQVVRDAAGEDIAYFEFLPAKPILPGAVGTRVVIFND